MADEVAGAEDEEGLGLAAEIVGDGEVAELDAGGVVDGEGGAAGGAGHGRVEGAVVAVVDEDLVAILPEQGEVGLVLEEDDLFVVAVLEGDGDALRGRVGDEVQSALDGVEVAGAVGGRR